MRKDMHKVLVEEPRHGGNRSKKYRRGNLPDEFLPKFEGIKRPHKSRKWFGEHLGPLKRWLRSNVGRPWNDVYSEAAEVMRGGNPVRTHIRSHMMDMIERHTFMRDGEVWCFRHTRETPISALGSYFVWPTFYVHPVTGKLMAVPERPRKRRSYRLWSATVAIAHASEIRIRRIDDSTVVRKLNGVWYACRVKQFPAEGKLERSFRHYDYAERKDLTFDEASAIYRDALVCIHKRQLSSKELKRLGLRNDTFLTNSDSAECASSRAHSTESDNIFGYASSLPAISGMVLCIGGFECD